MSQENVPVSERPRPRKPPKVTPDSTELSGMAVVYLIAVGFQVFVLLFIFAKRQIMRLAWPSRKEPHAPVGAGAPKKLRRRHVYQIEHVGRFRVEPTLLSTESDPACTAPSGSPNDPRMRAIDSLSALDETLATLNSPIHRRPRQALYPFLQRIKPVLCDMDPQMLVRAGLLYEHARYVQTEFGVRQYDELNNIMCLICRSIERNASHLPELARPSSSRSVHTDDDSPSDDETTPLDDDMAVRTRQPVVSWRRLRGPRTWLGRWRGLLNPSHATRWDDDDEEQNVDETETSL